MRELTPDEIKAELNKKEWEIYGIADGSLSADFECSDITEMLQSLAALRKQNRAMREALGKCLESLKEWNDIDGMTAASPPLSNDDSDLIDNITALLKEGE
jgi:hypothetical protein